MAITTIIGSYTIQAMAADGKQRCSNTTTKVSFYTLEDNDHTVMHSVFVGLSCNLWGFILHLTDYVTKLSPRHTNHNRLL